ncbi:MAG: hypothetical protein ACI4EF_02350 [Coprococcus sp.]
MTNATAYQKKEIKNKEMKVYLEFPEPTENDNQIKKEVKDILTNALQEHMKKSHNLKADIFFPAPQKGV